MDLLQLQDLLLLLGVESFEDAAREIARLRFASQQFATLLTPRADPHTTREIVADHAAGDHRFGHNPTWIKVATVAAFALATTEKPPRTE